MMRTKDGKIYDNKGIVVDGRWYSNPSEEQFIAAGWTEYVPPAPEPEPEDPDFVAVKAAFWGYVDEAAAALSEATGNTYTRADFPAARIRRSSWRGAPSTNSIRR